MKYPKTQTAKRLAPEDRPHRAFSDSAFRSLGTWVLLSLVWGVGYLAVCDAAPIPDREITVLQKEWAAAGKGDSAVDLRRACKRVIRKAEALLEANPDASNRYALLAIMFHSQKRLLSLETTERNRGALFETCRKLLKAPDEYAELRFDADMLLSEKELAESNATVEERVQAFEALLKQYRGTQAERRSLVIGSLIAPKLLAFELEERIFERMSEQFGGDHETIAFRWKQSNVSRLDVVFSGRYTSVDGDVIVFPHDRLGHHCLVIFWSKEAPEYETFLDQVKEQQERFPGRFEVVSFNLDELPDAGEKILRERGVKSTPMHLPGGRSNSAYRAYARTDPLALLVNGQGHVCLQRGKSLPWPATPGPRKGQAPGKGPGIGKWLDSDRYLAQLRSLFIGDFLVGELTNGKAASIPDETLRSIQTCFTPAPLRYRLTRKESLANYRKAETLCAEVVNKHRTAADLWPVRNRRIIALLGLWNLTGEQKYREEAVTEAKAVLALDTPAGAELAPRFCLAKQALRRADADPERLLTGFVEKAGGGDAPASALAAAAILAIEANGRTLYENYRQQLLDGDGDGNPRLWPVYAFLRDQHHRYRNFWATPGGYGYGRPQKYEFRNMVSDLPESLDRNRKLKAELETLDGEPLRIPQDTAGKMLGLLFAEPPVGEEAGKNLMNKVNRFAKKYTGAGVDVIVVFLAEDKDSVKSLVEDSEVECQVAILPKGLNNPLVQKLGILSADRIPNPFLLRPDGTIAWSISGLNYAAFRDSPDYAIGLGIRNNIAKVRSDLPFEALAKHEFNKALQLFEKSLPPNKEKDWWTAAHLHGRALAFMGLKEWKKALSEIDAAINQRKTDVRSGMCKCHGVVEMLLTKAAILEKLDRSREAAAQRRLAEQEDLPHPLLPPGVARQGVPVGVYYDWLKRIRPGLFAEGDTN